MIKDTLEMLHLINDRYGAWWDIWCINSLSLDLYWLLNISWTHIIYWVDRDSTRLVRVAMDHYVSYLSPNSFELIFDPLDPHHMISTTPQPDLMALCNCSQCTPRLRFTLPTNYRPKIRREVQTFDLQKANLGPLCTLNPSHSDWSIQTWDPSMFVQYCES
jgi:hypothetical protein